MLFMEISSQPISSQTEMPTSNYQILELPNCWKEYQQILKSVNLEGYLSIAADLYIGWHQKFSMDLHMDAEVIYGH
jgi:hypothetical protein